MINLILILTFLPFSLAFSISNEVVARDIHQQAKGAWVMTHDEYYDAITKRELNKVTSYHSRTIKMFDKGKGSKLFDCDDYALTFKAAVSYYSLLRGANYICGIIIVKQEKDFGGVEGGDDVYHALNLLMMNDTYIVLEPQGYDVVALSDYPNRANIIKVII